MREYNMVLIALSVNCVANNVSDQVRGLAPPLGAGKDSAEGVAVLCFSVASTAALVYWRTIEIGAPPQLESK
ncbi:hypothetical protein A7Q10_04515 [Methylacidiphilum caldifontis]|uniref:Uncharacterized protein n=1 Tax=Methylacidiphilum caldifontis TaxID=2795386 RepID=A0A4Y8PI16_9BACT|nr:hypothetical protein A7Q10_04515 [Methylacidiphilum caldifontis]